MSTVTLQCPSSVCAAGAKLLGIVLPDGRVAFASNSIAIDEEFVHLAREAGSPEKRFRFTSPCVRHACKQWSTDRCSVIDQALEAHGADHHAAALPACSIRRQCRWYAQVGRDACDVCTTIVTDQREEEHGHTG